MKILHTWVQRLGVHTLGKGGKGVKAGPGTCCLGENSALVFPVGDMRQIPSSMCNRVTFVLSFQAGNTCEIPPGQKEYFCCLCTEEGMGQRSHDLEQGPEVQASDWSQLLPVPGKEEVTSSLYPLTLFPPKFWLAYGRDHSPGTGASKML